MIPNDQPSLMKTVLYTMIRVTGFILTFFFMGGPYYLLLDELFGAATGRGITDLTTWATWIYQMFYYGFPSIMVFGILASVIYMFMVLRKRYFASDEVMY